MYKHLTMKQNFWQKLLIFLLLTIIVGSFVMNKKLNGLLVKEAYSKKGDVTQCDDGTICVDQGQGCTCVPKKPIGCWDSCKTGECPGNLDCNGRCVNPECPGKSNCECGGGKEDKSQCDFIKIYDAQGNQVQPTQIQPSVVYTVATNGKDANAAQMRATVNGTIGSWQVSTNKNGKGEFTFTSAFAQNINYELETEIKAYDKWWPGAACKISFKIGVTTPTLVCNNISRSPTGNLNVGDQISFACEGTSTNITINHYEFRLSSDGGTTYAALDSNNTTGSINYTVTAPGNYLTQCRVCSSTDSSQCTTWGQAGGWTPLGPPPR